MMLLKDLVLIGRQQIGNLILKPARCLAQTSITNWNRNTRSIPGLEVVPALGYPIETKTPFNIGNYINSKCYIGTKLNNSSLLAMSSVMGSFEFWHTSKKPVLGALTQQVRCFHAKGSKVQYLDFRYKFNSNRLRSHLLIIRRQKMKKHRRKKWRKKFKTSLAKMRLKREIAKEKTFRVELLTMIKRAEDFDPREYALRRIHEVNSRPVEKTREEKLEELKELIRQNRYQVDYIKPKHRRADTT